MAPPLSGSAWRGLSVGGRCRGGLNVEDAETGRCEDFDGLMNIDLVPSTNRPPRGGSSRDGLANTIWLGAGDEGPAPGLCGGGAVNLACG